MITDFRGQRIQESSTKIHIISIIGSYQRNTTTVKLLLVQLHTLPPVAMEQLWKIWVRIRLIC